MGLTGSKEAEPTQTVDELIRDWQAKPEIKKLEHFMGKLIEHMKHSYEELTGSKDISVKNKEFCRKFQIFVKSEIVSYVDKGVLTAHFKPYLKNKTISRKNGLRESIKDVLQRIWKFTGQLLLNASQDKTVLLATHMSIVNAVRYVLTFRKNNPGLDFDNFWTQFREKNLEDHFPMGHFVEFLFET